MTNGKAIWAGFKGGVGGNYVCFLVLATSVKRDFASESWFSESPRSTIQSVLEVFLGNFSLFSLCIQFELLTVTQINL